VFPWYQKYERYALWNIGLAVTLPMQDSFTASHLSFASEHTIPRGKLEEHFI
jgi:hypothetical protein